MTIESKFFDERINFYLQLFETIRAKVGDDQLSMALLEQCGKDSRMDRMRGANRAEPQSREAPATPRQLAFLDMLNVRPLPLNLSKVEASRLIDEAQARELDV